MAERARQSNNHKRLPLEAPPPPECPCPPLSFETLIRSIGEESQSRAITWDNNPRINSPITHLYNTATRTPSTLQPTLNNSLPSPAMFIQEATPTEDVARAAEVAEDNTPPAETTLEKADGLEGKANSNCPPDSKQKNRKICERTCETVWVLCRPKSSLLEECGKLHVTNVCQSEVLKAN